MTEATYNRAASSSGVRYMLGSASSGVSMGGERGIALFQLLFLSAIGLIVVFIAAYAISLSIGDLALLLVTAYIVAIFFWIRGKMRGLEAKATAVLGRRGQAIIDLRADAVAAEFTSASGSSSTVNVPIQNVRRAKVVNTLDKNLDVRSRDLTTAALALSQPTPTRTAAVVGAGAVGQARTVKARTTCFGVVLDHANTSVTLADGLDELTATNFFEDFLSDFARVQQSSTPVVAKP